MSLEPTPEPTPNDSEGILVTFPKGLLGFEQLSAFTLFEPADSYPLKFLQSNEKPEVSFICIDPATVRRDYQVPLTPEEAEALGLQAPEDALLLTIVLIPEDPRQMTTNLAGPLVINVRTRQGRQIILSSETYPLRCPILLRD